MSLLGEIAGDLFGPAAREVARVGREAGRALRLGYLTGRAAVHVLASPFPVGQVCVECGSIIARSPSGEVVVTVIPSGDRECPVHVAWRELLRPRTRPEPTPPNRR